VAEHDDGAPETVLPHFIAGGESGFTCKRQGGGHIHDTYGVAAAGQTLYILQRLNDKVFPDPRLVAENVYLVTSHLDRHCSRFGKVAPRLITTGNGKSYHCDDQGGVWRMLSYVDDCHSFDHISDPEYGYQAGMLLGRFHQAMGGFDVGLLGTALPGFHDLPAYLHEYQLQAAAFRATVPDRLRVCMEEIEARIDQALEYGRGGAGLKGRMIHGDPKCANMLFRTDDGTAAALIDLDTVSPGPVAVDLGDCLRSFCNSAGEGGEEAVAVVFDEEMAERLLNGYADSGIVLAEAETRSICPALRFITYELGLRFVTDYLAGNRYFRISHPEDNLIRASVQFSLLRAIETRHHQLHHMITRILAP
jgi:Ser/Thr protein kinase RdoA (MazF antagonist)